MVSTSKMLDFSISQKPYVIVVPCYDGKHESVLKKLFAFCFFHNRGCIKMASNPFDISVFSGEDINLSASRTA